MVFQFADFMAWLPLDYDFERMANNNDDYADMSYEQFVEWNRERFNESSEADRALLSQLCTSIMNGRFTLMDLESCVEFNAHGVYFNTEKKICIYNQR